MYDVGYVERLYETDRPLNLMLFRRDGRTVKLTPWILEEKGGSMTYGSNER